MGIALQIIDIATASIPADLAGAEVTRVNLKVGKLSAVIPENLRFCFDVAVRDTALEGAELNIKEIPVAARCNDCGHRWTLSEPAFACPACEGGAITVLSGRELDIESIEINEEHDHAATRG
jgi:hydrogenase nickel incorporation protein HypA/HybF